MGGGGRGRGREGAAEKMEMEMEMEEEGEMQWGTWEELVLGSAVKRHGTHNWDLVSHELQARNLSSYVFSPQACKARYDALQGRFSDNRNDKNNDADEMPWLEELRRLRVAQLKKELQRSDDSIGCLQSKLQRLEAERAQSLRRIGDETEAASESKQGSERSKDRSSAGSFADRQIERRSDPLDSEPRPVDPEPPTKSAPEDEEKQTAKDEVTRPCSPFYGSSETQENRRPKGDESKSNHQRHDFVRDSRKAKQQRSRRPRTNGPRAVLLPHAVKNEPQSHRDGDEAEEAGRRENRQSEGVECSADPDDDRASIGCTDTAEAPPRRRRGRRKQESRRSSGLEFDSETTSRRPKSEGSGESSGKGPGEERATHPTESDMLSSANQEKAENFKESEDYTTVTRSSGDSHNDNGRPEGTDEIEYSPVSQRSRREPKVAGKLLPLLDCLRSICSHKFGYVFKRRLESQNTQRYKELIKRHMDLATIRSKLEEGTYSGSIEFFRDLLLVFNNALVFYAKSSPEYAAARILRQQAVAEMSKIFQTEALLKQEGPSTRKREPKRQNFKFSPGTVGRKRNVRSTSARPKSALKLEKFSAEDLLKTAAEAADDETEAPSAAPRLHEPNANAGVGRKLSGTNSNGRSQGNDNGKGAKGDPNAAPAATPPVKRGVGRPPKHAKKTPTTGDADVPPRQRKRPRR